LPNTLVQTRLVAPVVTTTSIILAPIKYRMVPVPIYPHYPEMQLLNDGTVY